MCQLIRWSFEIGIGGEGDEKFWELISRIREAFWIAADAAKFQERNK